MMNLCQLIEVLSRPECYPHPAGEVKVVQTQISAVFLVGELVYKIKKPVDFGFVDSRTLTARLHFCREEVRLNSRLAPGVYLGVVPVTRDGEHVQVDGRQGEVIEWAVKMRRLRDEDNLEQCLARGEFTDELARDLGRCIAEFHRTAARSPAIAEYGRFDNVRQLISENLAQARAHCQDFVSGKLIERVTHLTHQALANQQQRIDRRAQGGIPCDAHGDLRLEHIYQCQPEGARRWTIVDGIEFSERYRYGDPVLDAAFLVMDLQFHGRRDLARAFVESYLDAAGDAEGNALMSLYSSYRAIVRSKVEALKAGEPEVPKAEQTAALVNARAYWLLALGELETPSLRPCLVLIGGLPGTGKSTLSRRLAETQNLTIIRTDEVRKELAGIDAGARAGSEFGTGLYAPAWSERTYAECLRRAEQALWDGERVAVDASFAASDNRDSFLALAERLRVPAILFICRADRDLVRQRLDARRGDASDADWNIYEQATKAWEPLSPKSLAAVHDLATADGASAAAEASSRLSSLNSW